MSSLPYVTSPGNIQRSLDGIKKAATPPKVTQDFVKTVLHIQGGSGNQITSFLKKIGFALSDGTPSTLYTKFRNPTTSGAAVAEAIRKAYAPLYVRNEYMHELDDQALLGLIVEETGQAHDSNVVTLVLSTIKHLKNFADFSAKPDTTESVKNTPSTQFVESEDLKMPQKSGVGLNLSYTINLNLPATTDIAVFNAIFKSLKENLLEE